MNDLAVLIPAYRANDTIERCLRSLAAQTLEEFTVIVLVDGEDKDFPIQRCREIIRSSPLRALQRGFSVQVSRLHQGVAATRNDLLFYAENLSYRYAAWQDADDESEPERLGLQREYLEGHPGIFMVGTWITEIEANGKERGIDTPTDPHEIREAYYAGQQAVSGATAMFRLHSPWRDEHGAPVGGIRFREDLPIGEDFVFNLEVQKRWPLCQANIPQRLYRYHRQPGGGAVRRYRARAARGEVPPIGEHMKECVARYG